MEDYMKRALQLAERGRGRTHPNPMVGAVLVKNGEIVGEGFHPRTGEPHAEILALRQAGRAAQGATLYVTLEPCCHFGRTPPCSRAIIEARIAAVHMAMLDPNPRVSGQGRAELEAARICTVVGEHEEEARALNEVFIHWISRGTPFVTVKFAMSLDGKTATSAGESRWITGDEARHYVHRLRDEVAAILVGANTVLADDPQLTTRLDKSDARHPLRVILDSQGRIPPTAKVFDPALEGKTLLATTEAAPLEQRRILMDRGIEVLVLPVAKPCGQLQRSEWVSLHALLEALGKREVSSLLVEGGATVLGSFFDQRLVNKVLAFVAPVIIGGQEAPGVVGGVGVERIRDVLRLDKMWGERLGCDMLIGGYPIQEVSQYV